jgi:hypothetical protein
MLHPLKPKRTHRRARYFWGQKLYLCDRILHKFCLSILLVGLVSGCQNITTIANEELDNTAIVTPNKQAQTSNRDQALLTENVRGKEKEDIIEQWLHKPLDKYDKGLNQTLLREKSKFGKMATACHPTLGDRAKYFVQGELSLVTQLEPDLYLLQLTCGHGRGANHYSWFIYSYQTGIQPDALKLQMISMNKFGAISSTEETSVFAREYSFDSLKKEITISIPCHFADGLQASRVVYKYEDSKMKLIEYWQDEIYNEKCTQKPKLKQLYP